MRLWVLCPAKLLDERVQGIHVAEDALVKSEVDLRYRNQGATVRKTKVEVLRKPTSTRTLD